MTGPDQHPGPAGAPAAGPGSPAADPDVPAQRAGDVWPAGPAVPPIPAQGHPAQFGPPVPGQVQPGQVPPVPPQTPAGQSQGGQPFHGTVVPGQAQQGQGPGGEQWPALSWPDQPWSEQQRQALHGPQAQPHPGPQPGRSYPGPGGPPSGQPYPGPPSGQPYPGPQPGRQQYPGPQPGQPYPGPQPGQQFPGGPAAAYPPHQPPPEQDWRPTVTPQPASPKRRFPRGLLIAAGVVVLALGIGIPTGLALTSTETGAAPETAQDEPPNAPPPTLTAPEPAPPGLTPEQADLWERFTMSGVDAGSCRGYDDGERVTAAVMASLECDVEDDTFDQPIVFYRFPDADAVEEYLDLRAGEVDGDGSCQDGEEEVGTWSATESGGPVGDYVCVDNAKDGVTYFKIVWTNPADGTVAVVQHETASVTVDWWRTHGPAQFPA